MTGLPGIQIDLQPLRPPSSSSTYPFPLLASPSSLASSYTTYYRPSPPLTHLGETAADVERVCVDLRWARSDAGTGRVKGLVEWVEDGGMGVD